MLVIKADPNICIDLGRRGEDRARKIDFDISGWEELYGKGEARLVAKRYKDFSPYKVPAFTHDGTTVTWEVRAFDVDNPGYGVCELVYITDGSVVKSVTYQTKVDISLSDPVTPVSVPSIYADLERRINSIEDSQIELKDALEQALSEPNFAEQLEMLIEADMLPAIHDVDGKILTDENGNIILRY